MTGEQPDTAAEAALNRVTAWCAAATRFAVALTGGIAAVAGMGGPATAVWVVPAVLLSVVWSVAFGWCAVTQGLRTPLVTVDIVLTTALCLLQARLVAPPLLSGGASWIDGLASITIVIASLAWRPRVAVPTGLLVAGAHLVGAWQAGDGIATTGIHLVQIAATAALMTLLRTGARLADAVLAEGRETERAAAVMRARRADERANNLVLHDTVLATLTTIGANSITATSPALRARAAADLALIENLGPPGLSGTDVDLRHQLRAVADRAEVAVDCELVPCRVPVRVATAFADAAAEALANIARHAGVDTARLRQHGDCHAVRIAITDTGRGFDPAAVPRHRYGLREGILGRMRAVEGDAEVVSGAGGTRVELRWPH
ncbi:hypothetical protein [Actinokineospora sp. NBRC 105648]|uniref:hypothetical protein n=1 Tax=Actinokineospora sp. NBRC 105648 TaxID=3032206 RepID=UPI0024A3A00C|nr:hypothetical protein [Actinokineospora sp. NBRC 105648]GLZ36574.1 hypothetical protein Acsp05_01990 [Actinokineospora sp. NBRC 105648]